MTCEEYESQGLCFNGTFQTLQDEELHYTLFEEEQGECGMTAVNSCCACGGGIKPDDDEVNFEQLVEWKIVLGDGSPEDGHHSVNFYDANFGGTQIYENNTTETNDNDIGINEQVITAEPSFSPSAEVKPPTIPPTYKLIEIQDWEDTELSREGLQGFLTGVKNFFSNLFGGETNGEDGDGEASKASSIVAWIITFGFSIFLLMRGSSLCDFHLNFQREQPRRGYRTRASRSRRSRRSRRS